MNTQEQQKGNNQDDEALSDASVTADMYKELRSALEETEQELEKYRQRVRQLFRIAIEQSAEIASERHKRQNAENKLEQRELELKNTRRTRRVSRIFRSSSLNQIAVKELNRQISNERDKSRKAEKEHRETKQKLRRVSRALNNIRHNK